MPGRVARSVCVAVVLGLGALAIALPDAILVGGAAWLIFLTFVLSGWGWLIGRVLRAEAPELAVRAIWGIAAYLAIAGPLVMLGVFGRPAILVLVAIGAVAFAWRELTTPQPMTSSVRAAFAYARAKPLIAYLVVLLAAAAVIQALDGVAHLDRSPWDDDVAYTPLVARLLDCGDLIEPFSFRRLASYGGQTALQALVGARGSLVSVHALDQGLCFALTLMLVIGYARALRVSAFWTALLVVGVLVMPDISINTASYWSGAAAFIALYRAVSARQWLVAALIGAAACTLRHTYIPVTALFLVFALAFERAPRRAWIHTIAVAGGAVVCWCIAAFVSSRTFLFPFMQGTWNHGLTLGPSGWTWLDELQLFVNTMLYTEPFVLVVIVAPLIVFTADGRTMRPLHALFAASALGFMLLVHSFTDADADSMWRYAFAYAFTLFAMFALEVASDGESAQVRIAPLGRWVVMFALVLHIAGQRTGKVDAYQAMIANIGEAAALGGNGDPSSVVERAHYRSMQAAVPAGARLFVMVDDPAYLDFSRNDIANIDVPGFASPGAPQMPYFVGAEAKRSYLLDRGYRYLAFVRSDRSRYVFRREFWVWRVLHDTEFFQAMSAYSIDAIESFAELAQNSHVLHDDDGLVVLDLEQPHAAVPSLSPHDEHERRDAWTAELARREHFERAYALTTRAGLVFGDGMSGLEVAEGEQPIRWLGRRVHLRLRGEHDMHLVLRGHVMVNQLYTHARLDVSLDGALLTSVTTDDSGLFQIDVIIPRDRVASWSDLYVVFNAIGQPEREVHDLKLARLEEVTWEPH